MYSALLLEVTVKVRGFMEEAELTELRKHQPCVMCIGRKFAWHCAHHSVNSGCVSCGGINVELLSALAFDCLCIWGECVVRVLQACVIDIVTG